MKAEAVEQYNRALKAGQKYYKNAVNRGEYPYPLVLDEIIDETEVAGSVELGMIDIPSALIAGTRSAGRISALAGNFMPLLDSKTEFAAKWINLCDAQLGNEGIRDPIKCYEYMGRFYIEEGNKRVSVLLNLCAPTVSGYVTRLLPRWSDDPETQIYYEFLRFYTLSGLYGINFHKQGGYAKLQAALGFDEDYVWTPEERRSFSAGFAHFTAAFDVVANGRSDVTPAEALLVWLQVFPFSEIKKQTQAELVKNLTGIWPDVETFSGTEDAVELNTEPENKSKSLLSKILGFGRADHINVAFIYAFDPVESVWTRAHDLGRKYVEEQLGERVTVRVYQAADRDYYGAMQTAVSEGAKLIFATTPGMIGACRRIAAEHADIKILNCGLSQPYAGVRRYYSRIYECKFITGAIAGAMAEGDSVGYIANYPIMGTPAHINAFALGVRLTNPRARVKLVWSCTEGDPLEELTGNGVSVISNRVAVGPHAYWALEWGLYMLDRNATRMTPLAAPYWNWGRMYEQIILSIFNGTWAPSSSGRAVHYWWGMGSGVLDVHFSDTLPEGLRSLGKILKDGILDGCVTPFQTQIIDQSGTIRNDGSRPFTPEEIMHMDWLCDTVDGTIPRFNELLPMSKETVRLLGIYREELPPEKEEKQL